MKREQNPNTTVMSYFGNIDMSIKIKGKVYTLETHNEGLLYLKYLFAKTLVGDALGSADIPTYINLVKVVIDEKGNESELDFLDKHILISNSGKNLVDIVDGYATAATFTAYIQASALLDEVDAASTDKFYLYLLTGPDVNNGNAKHKLARFNIKPVVLSYITPGTTATLNWTLKIVNGSEDT